MEKLKGVKSKLFFMIFLFGVLLLLANVKSYAAEPFKLDKTTIDVKLNSTVYIGYTGGTGTVEYTVSDPTIVEMDGSLVKGLKIGSTTITAKRGEETATCTVNVVYESISLSGNSGLSSSDISLYLEEHPTEKIKAKVKDGKYEEVANAEIQWSSSDSSVVTVDGSGNLTAKKAGSAKITATAAGVSDEKNVNVYALPNFTDFSNAKFENSIYYSDDDLKISGIKPNSDNLYYVAVTKSNSKPEIIKKDYGSIDTEKMDLVYLSRNTEENYIYANIAKYSELYSEMYLWIFEDAKLTESYYTDDGKSVYHTVKTVVEGKKYTRQLPQLNLVLQKFNVSGGYTDSSAWTSIWFNMPTDSDKRKFTLKIGKVTDNTILNKIKSNDYSGITSLLDYAKKNSAVYNQNLTTTSKAYFRSDTSSLFDGKKLLEDEAYYYIYAVFDDENGKYAPVEGVTLAQAWLSTTSNYWNLYAYTSSDFKWLNSTTSGGTTGGTTTTNTQTPTGTDSTTANTILPKTGAGILVFVLAGTIIVGFIMYHKYEVYKDI